MGGLAVTGQLQIGCRFQGKGIELCSLISVCCVSPRFAATPAPLASRSGLASMQILHCLDGADLRPQLPQELPRCVVVGSALWQQEP